MTRRTQFRSATAAGLSILVACGSADSAVAPTAVAASPAASASPAATMSAAGTDTEGMYAHFYGVQVSRQGSTVVLRATSVPDHPSPYFDRSNPLYEAPGSTRVNPHHIATQDLVFRVPAAPQLAGGTETNLGPIGVAVNGVAFFNQYAAGRTPLDDEIQSFDRGNGHPAPSNLYHYHMEPLFLTALGSSRLVGVLLDGFPVYGTRDQDGSAPRDLDVCNGHTGATADFPAGIYHYHLVAAPPYIAGCYRGQAGQIG